MPEETTPRGGNGRLSRTILGVMLALVLSTGAFFSGLHIGAFSALTNEEKDTSLLSLFAGNSQPPADADLQEFWRVWELLDEKFANATSSEQLTTEEKIEGAINGLVKSYGDPYTVFMPPQDAAQFSQDISGNFSGVGMEVGMRGDVITVIAPLQNTPADLAGIAAGDVIVTIDGTSTENMTVDEAVRRIRGEAGTVINLEIYRSGEAELLPFAITRAQIEVPTVVTSEDKDVFIISLYSFNSLAETKMREAVEDYIKSGKEKLVLDLRGNPGGYLESAVTIAGYFMPAGKVVLRESFSDDRPEEVYRTEGAPLKKFAPQEMVVLIDQGSASASEILAGALSQHGYAILVGENSFGKGSVQEVVDLPSGGALKVTIARWLTPDGTSISNGGLTPEIAIERTPEDREAERDPQLETALSYLRGTYVPPAATSTPATN